MRLLCERCISTGRGARQAHTDSDRDGIRSVASGSCECGGCFDPGSCKRVGSVAARSCKSGCVGSCKRVGSVGSGRFSHGACLRGGLKPLSFAFSYDYLVCAATVLEFPPAFSCSVGQGGHPGPHLVRGREEPERVVCR